VAYTGGVNLADEYIGEVIRFGHWKDSALRLEGDAVAELAKLFLIDFGISVKEAPGAKHDYFPQGGGKEDTGYVLPFGDGPRPIYPRTVAKDLILAMLAGAKRSVHITTPYLIIDNELCHALENAALRGVDVKLILPHIPDKKLVFAMSRTHYPRLMRAGVEVYEYTPGFIHAKNYMVDGEIALCGTINLDYRSLVHHFECGVWMYRTPVIAEMESDFAATLTECMRVEQKALHPRLSERIAVALVKVFSPLL
jgi:cardiolipin synthase